MLVNKYHSSNEKKYYKYLLSRKKFYYDKDDRKSKLIAKNNAKERMKESRNRTFPYYIPYDIIDLVTDVEESSEFTFND